MMKAINISNENENIIGDKIIAAETFWTRLRGLLNRRNLSQGEGLLLRNCNSIHSIGMRFNFDAVFLNRENEVVFLAENIPPMKILPIVLKARHVLELHAGTIKCANIKIGDKINFIIENEN